MQIWKNESIKSMNKEYKKILETLDSKITSAATNFGTLATKAYNQID